MNMEALQLSTMIASSFGGGEISNSVQKGYIKV